MNKFVYKKFLNSDDVFMYQNTESFSNKLNLKTRAKILILF